MERLKYPLSALLLVLASLLLCSCASTKYKVIHDDKRSAPMNLGLGTEAGGLSTSIDALIIYEGPGSWKRKARWDEYVLTVRNPGRLYAQVLEATLEDGLGHELPLGTDPWALEKASTSEMERYARTGLQVVEGVGGAATWLFSVAVVSIAGTGFVSSGALAVCATTAVALPAVFIGHLIANHGAKQAVLTEFNRRRLQLPQTIPLEGELKGSLFFPICPAPRRLTLDCRVDGHPVRLVIELKPLEKLHIVEPGK